MQLLSTPVLRVPVDDRAIVAERERRRLDAVARYAILDSPAEEAFDRITRLAAQLFEVPMAFVSIVARDRTWFKSAHGLSAIAEIPREPGLCSTAIETNEPYVLEDASADERSRENSLVSGPLGVRFYAGVPLHTHDGHNLGALCVLDDVPHSIDDAKLDMLVTLGQVVVDELELRCRSAERAASIDSATGLLDRNALDSALDDYFAAFLRGTTSDGSLVAPARRDEFRLTREASTRTRRRSAIVYRRRRRNAGSRTSTKSTDGRAPHFD